MLARDASKRCLPNKDPAVEVNAEAEEGLYVAAVAVGMALQTLQQDPGQIVVVK
jgi:hypothetical protein